MLINRSCKTDFKPEVIIVIVVYASFLAVVPQK